MHRFPKLIGYVLRQRSMLLVILACTLGFTATTALEPWPMKLLIDYALGNTEVPPTLADLLLALHIPATPTALVILAALASLGLFVVNSALGVAMGLAWSIGGQRMVYALAGDLLARL